MRKFRPNLINVISISVTNLPEFLEIESKYLPKENATLTSKLIQEEYKRNIFYIEKDSEP